MTSQETRRLLLLALAAACVWTFHYPLMWALRRAAPPAERASWANDGSFAVIGYWGLETGDEATYAARVAETARDGLPGEPWIAESPDARILPMDFLTYLVMGWTARLAGGVNAAWLLLRFLCAAAWFILLYFMARRAGAEPPLATLAAAFCTFFSYLPLLLVDIPALEPWSLRELVWTMATHGRTDSLLRLPRPGLTYPALFAAGLLAVRAARTRTAAAAAAAGLAAGALAYVRTDVWSTALAAWGLYAAAVSLRERRFAWTLWAAFAAAVLASLPWVFATMPPDPEVIERWAPIWGRAPSWRSLPYLAAAAAVWAWGRRSDGLLWIGCVCGAVVAALNVQIVTGYSVAPGHWEKLGAIYLSLAVFLAAGPRLMERMSPERRRRAALAGFGALALACAAQNAVFAARRYQYQALPRETEAALAWLRESTPEDSVVAALSVEASILTPVYGHNKTLIGHPSQFLSGVRLSDNVRRLAYMLGLLGTDARAWISRCVEGYRHAEERPPDRASLERRRWLDGYFLYYPREKVEETLLRAEADLADFAPRVDYLWIGPFEREFTGPDFPKSSPLPLEKAYENAAIAIYRVRPPQ